MVTLTHNQIIAIESIAIGAIGAGGQGAYQALSSHSGQPLQVGQIVAAFLLPALGYVLTALHWLSVPAAGGAVSGRRAPSDVRWTRSARERVAASGNGIGYDEVAAITGVGRTTFFDWERTARVPRPATTRRLLRVYALTKAVVAHLGATEAAAWFRTGQPSPLDLLRDQDLDFAERAASVVLFRETEAPRDYAAFVSEPEFDVGPLEPTPFAKRVVRSARRVTPAR